jgi:glycosyltransferase involved in cell wall biosynthesis
LENPFLLYVGRVDASKNCGELCDHFISARKRGVIQHKLVLAGKEVMRLPFHDDLICLGFVDEEQKWQAIAACDWLVAPSELESLSMALLEGWSLEKPALVNGRSDVMRAHCQSSHGGLWYENGAEWASALTCIDDATKRQLGRNGRHYVEENFSWERVENAYLDLLRN